MLRQRDECGGTGGGQVRNVMSFREEKFGGMKPEMAGEVYELRERLVGVNCERDPRIILLDLEVSV